MRPLKVSQRFLKSVSRGGRSKSAGTMTMLSSDVHQSLTALRRAFHRIPELGFNEYKTSDLICQTLDAIDIPYVRGVGGTGVVASLRRGDSTAAVGFRADIDALPITEISEHDYGSRHEGVMHACGHDGHTAMLLGAADYIKHHTAFDGTVHFIFQPAEEHGKGALKMIADGLFERFSMDEVYGLHNMPLLEAGQIALKAGPIMGAEDNFVITVTGQGGHAAMPHAGKDAMTIAASIVTELQTIVSRNIDPLQGGVVSCTEFLTDGAVNVIPTVVTIKGDARSFDPEVSALIERRIHEVAKGICAAHGASVDCRYERIFLPTVNASDQAQKAAQAASMTVAADKLNDHCAPMMASEDFGAMLMQRPGCYAFIGNRDLDGTGSAMLHNASYDFNDAIIPTGVRYWANLASVVLPDRKA